MFSLDFMVLAMFGTVVDQRPVVVTPRAGSGTTVAIHDGVSGALLSHFDFDHSLSRWHVFRHREGTFLVGIGGLRDKIGRVVRCSRLPAGLPAEEIWLLPSPARRLNSYPTDDGGRILLAATEDGMLRRFDLSSGKELAVIQATPAPTRYRRRESGQTAGFTAVATFTAGAQQRLVAASLDGNLAWFDIDSGEVVTVTPSLHFHRGGRGDVLAIYPYQATVGPMLATHGYDGTIRLWDATAATPVGDPIYHSNMPVGVCPVGDPDQPILAVAYDSFVQLYDGRTGDSVADRLSWRTDNVEREAREDELLQGICAVEIDGRQALFVVDDAGVAWRFDARTGKPWPAQR
jgi:hypothetical protein